MAQVPLYQRLAYRPTSPVSLEELPESFYALQLLALRSQTRLDEVAEQLGIPGMARIPIESNGELWHVLLLRIYPDRATAERAAASLPPRIRELNPWSRPLRSLQQAMAQGTRLRQEASDSP
jgi:septal ring-binding cell division protein DamX